MNQAPLAVPPSTTTEDGAAALTAEMAEVSACCREALATEFAEVVSWLPPLRRAPDEWFDLARGHPHRRGCLAELQGLVALAEIHRAYRPGMVAKFVLLQAMLAAVPRLPLLPVDMAVKRLFCRIFLHLAGPEGQWRDDFSADHWELREALQLVTLRRFPAGQHDWELTRVPLSAPVRLRPRHLPGFARALVGLGGIGPVANLHLSPWRTHTLSLPKSESLRSYHRIARSLELQPRVRGLIGVSWFYSEIVGHASPHLAWLRDFFLRAGAYVGEMEPSPAGKGLLVGSSKRRQLYDKGEFRPNVTLVLWPRHKMLAWARKTPPLEE